MKISVVIPVFNEEKQIAKCLKSIFSQIELPDEVIVVDNNCTDNTITITKTFPGVRVVKEKTQGMTPARNKGFNSAKFDIIARTDADTIVSKNWVKRIKQDFGKYPDMVGVSGPGNSFSEFNIVKKGGYQQIEKIYFKIFEQIYHHHVLVGPNMAIRKNAWLKIRHDICLEDKIVHEDVDLTIHLAQVGKILFDKKMQVVTSSRRWRKPASHWEYPYRYARTVQHHKQSLHGIKVRSQMVGKMLPKPKRIMKRIRTSLETPLHLRTL